MRKKLLLLSDKQLQELGSCFSISGSREQIVKGLVEYFRAYNLRWEDVATRFSLNS